MPRVGSLPKTLQPLLHLQAIELRPEHFKVDCQKLILELEELAAAERTLLA
jgi:hypothetical protein